MKHKEDIQIELAEEFIKNTDNFFDENYELIDLKHNKIIKNFYSEIKNNKNYFKNKLRNWSMQEDHSCPPQLSFLKFKILGVWKVLKFYLLRKIYNIFNFEHERAFFDDLEILKKNCNLSILKNNPVHLTPGCDNFYESKENIITNYRWNRYLYIADRILKNNILDNNEIWIDIGPFYGGLQSIIKKEKPNINIFLVDFKHQLCRSYIFLKQLFPESKHLLPNQINKNLFNESLSDSIVYIPVEKFDLINSIKAKLITNIFSFGEMKEQTFENYKNSKVYKNAKFKFLINRFVSSPYFEKTYDNSTNILNYLNKDTIKYFDIFPIHHYQSPKRKLFGSIKNRPMSSPYFELLLENNE